MSRVSYVMMNPGGDKELTKRRARLPRQARRPSSRASRRRRATTCSRSCSSATRSCTTSCSASTRRELGGAPFALADRRGACACPRRELGLPVHAGARAYVLPCIAGHVGADTAGVILAEGPHRRDEVDAARRRRHQRRDRARQPATGCSRPRAPPGPAFEGAQISCGQRAAPGAIERVRIDPRHARAAVQGDRLRCCGRTSRGSPSAAHGVTGICGSGIIEVVAELYLAGVHRRRRHDRRRASPSARRGSSPTSARSRTCCTAPASRSCDHAERRSRRSSWPRRRCTPGPVC